MKHSRILSLLLFILACASVQAAGPMGHYIIARKVIHNIAAGGFTAPPQLIQLLRDPDCQRAYCAGAIGPDLVEAKSHYGNTADLVRRMFTKARADQKAAAAAKNAKAFAEAKQELAFSYGWISHFVMDMNTHQLVNGMQGIGDAYTFTTKSQQVSHGIYEAQLCAYLRRTIWNSNDKYDVLIPYNFLASIVNVDAAKIKQMAAVLRGKAAGEMMLAGNCDLPTEQLAKIWNRSTTVALQEVARYLASPESLENWDMDVGHISTEDFTSMRSMVIQINDSKLPADWGKQYPVYWDAIKSLSPSARYAKLQELLGKNTSAAPLKLKIYFGIHADSSTGGYSQMPGDWNEFGISAILEVDCAQDGSFRFEKKIADPEGMGHMSSVLKGTGAITSKGDLTLSGSVTGGQRYISRYNSDGPDYRFTQNDEATFSFKGNVTFKRSSNGAIREVIYKQTEAKGSYKSSMSITELDKDKNDVAEKRYSCSGGFTPKAGISEIDIRK